MAYPFSGGSSQPRNWTNVSCIAHRFFTNWVIREALVNPRRNQSWIFVRMTDAEMEAPKLWPLDVKSWLIVKDPDAGKTEGRRTTEEEVVGWHHWLNWHGCEQVLGNGEGQGSLAWHAAVHGVAKSQTWPSNWTTNSRRWWRAGKPGILQSIGLQRVWSYFRAVNKGLLILMSLSGLFSLEETTLGGFLAVPPLISKGCLF